MQGCDHTTVCLAFISSLLRLPLLGRSKHPFAATSYVFAQLTEKPVNPLGLTVGVAGLSGL